MTRTQTGSKLVIGLTLLAVAAGATAWIYQYSATNHAAQFWGSPGGRLIVAGEQVTALVLAADHTAVDGVVPGYSVAESRDVSRGRGVLHLRHALVQDRNYDWESAPVDDVAWELALVFADAAGEQVVLFGNDWHVVGRVTSEGVEAVSSTPMAATLREFFVGEASLSAAE